MADVFRGDALNLYVREFSEAGGESVQPFFEAHCNRIGTSRVLAMASGF
jgi:hypothetical protein